MIYPVDKFFRILVQIYEGSKIQINNLEHWICCSAWWDRWIPPVTNSWKVWGGIVGCGMDSACDVTLGHAYRIIAYLS